MNHVGPNALRLRPGQAIFWAAERSEAEAAGGWLYHGSVHQLAHRVLEAIRRQDLLRPGDRVGTAVSGGPDSVALLRLLLELRGELGLVLSVVHVNHKLRGADSDSDEAFVAELARKHKLQLHACSADVTRHAGEKRVSIETAARELRHDFFRKLLGATGQAQRAADKIATGHTLDDQAETVLMRLIRGTGMRGLGGIHPRIQVDVDTQQVAGAIVRPLLRERRRELEQYLNELKQPWRQDATNRDLKFTRNRVRHTLLPLLEGEFNRAIAEGLAELSEIARGEEDYWENEVSGWMGTVVQWFNPANSPAEASGDLVRLTALPGASAHQELLGQKSRIRKSRTRIGHASLSRTWLLAEPLAVQRRVVKSIGNHTGLALEYKHIEEILQFAAEEAGSGKQLVLPAGWQLVREDDTLIFQAPDFQTHTPAAGYEYQLAIPGAIDVAEIGVRFEATPVIPAASNEPYDADRLFDRSLLAETLTVRNWRPGDRFWPARTKCPRKVKELLQEHHVPRPQRKLWPVIVSGDEIVWIPGLPGAAKYRPQPGTRAVLLRDLPLCAPNG
jgi:tRNA(Ile)-lysidine synthase